MAFFLIVCGNRRTSTPRPYHYHQHGKFVSKQLVSRFSRCLNVCLLDGTNPFFFFRDGEGGGKHEEVEKAGEEENACGRKKN